MSAKEADETSIEQKIRHVERRIEDRYTKPVKDLSKNQTNTIAAYVIACPDLIVRLQALSARLRASKNK